MRHKLPRILLLSAWLVATGGLRDLVQVVAWVRMFSSEIASASVLEAAKDTFSAEKKCKLCLLVERGKRAHDETSGTFTGMTSKAPVVFPSVARIIVGPPAGVSAWWRESGFACFRREVPPVPPPRGRKV